MQIGEHKSILSLHNVSNNSKTGEKFGETFSDLPFSDYNNSNSKTEQAMKTQLVQGKERDKDPVEEFQVKLKKKNTNFIPDICPRTSMVKNIHENEKLDTHIDKKL